MKPAIPPELILRVLEELACEVPAPLWLFGGVAVDFLVGRWTRPHGDIDCNALTADRSRIVAALRRLGYAGEDAGWLTHWRRAGEPQVLEIVFLEADAAGRVELVVREGDAAGVPGRYAMVEGHLDPARFASLDGVNFRVSSPEGEWLARVTASSVVAGREAEPKIEHDRRLLETLVPEKRRRELADPSGGRRGGE